MGDVEKCKFTEAIHPVYLNLTVFSHDEYKYQYFRGFFFFFAVFVGEQKNHCCIIWRELEHIFATSSLICLKSVLW